MLQVIFGHLINLIRLRGVGTSTFLTEGSGEYKPRNAEGFLPANDEATPQVVFITHEVTKTGVCLLRYHLIPPELHKFTSVKVDAA